MPAKRAIVLGSIAGLAVLAATAFVASARKNETGEGGNKLPTSPDLVEWLNVSLGLPASTEPVQGPSGRMYQVTIWAATGKEAVLIVSSSPRAFYAVARDSVDRKPLVLLEQLPDEIARSDVAALVKSF